MKASWECNMISEVCRWRTDTSLFTEVGKVTFKIIVAFNYCMNHRGDCIYIRQDAVPHVAWWVLRTQRWRAQHKIVCWRMKEVQDPIAASNTVCTPWPGLRPGLLTWSQSQVGLSPTHHPSPPPNNPSSNATLALLHYRSKPSGRRSILSSDLQPVSFRQKVTSGYLIENRNIWNNASR